jgi:tRNA pseudouridine55 synthase
MAKRKKGDPINGWVVIDKPLKMTSTQVVGRVRRYFNAQKVGHAGTLDPLATGVLPIALGEATKTIPFAQDSQKSYRFEIRWGEATETDDAEGAVTATSNVRPVTQAIHRALSKFQGKIEQVPPAYSAIKIAGERAYDLARRGEAPVLKSRTIEVERFEVEEIVGPDRARFRVDCAKGTYVRALARDLAQELGTFGHVTLLRRTKVGVFDEAQAISLELLEDLSHSARAFERLLPVQTVLDDIPALAVTDEEAACLRQGQSISLIGKAFEAGSGLDPLVGETVQSAVVAMERDDQIARPVAIGRIEKGAFQPTRVFNF